MKLDMVMWTLGKPTLKLCLRRIREVVPSNVVNTKFLVVREVTDFISEMAVKHDWLLIKQKSEGIPDAAQTALDQVETKRFITFEDDLILCDSWFKKMIRFMEKHESQVASGIRFSYESPTVRKLQQYVSERYRKWQSGIPAYLRQKSRLKSAFMWGKTLDNTIYTTDVLREVGGFPQLETSGGVDIVLASRLADAGYKWDVNYDAVSRHIGFTFEKYLRSYHFYASCWDEIAKHTEHYQVNMFDQVTRLFYSPVAGFHIAATKRAPQMVFAYPLLRLNALRGLFASRRKRVPHLAEVMREK